MSKNNKQTNKQRNSDRYCGVTITTFVFWTKHKSEQRKNKKKFIYLLIDNF